MIAGGQLLRPLLRVNKMPSARREEFRFGYVSRSLVLQAKLVRGSCMVLHMDEYVGEELEMLIRDWIWYLTGGSAEVLALATSK